MRLCIANIGPIVDMELELKEGKVTHLPSDNATGKTTVAACLAACLSQNPDPLKRGISRKKSYIRRGADPEASHARLWGESGWVEWQPAEGCFATFGTPPQAPELAVMPPAGRSKQQWLEAIVCEPITVETLTERLVGILGEEAYPVAADYAEEILCDEPSSWAVFEGIAKERRAAGKRKWQEAVASTGEHSSYGSKIAAAWKPDGWRPDFAQESQESIKRQIREAETKLSSAQREVAAIESAFKAFERSQDALRRHESRIETAKATVARLAAMPEVANAFDIEAYNERVEKLNSELEGYRVNISALENRQVEFDSMIRKRIRRIQEEKSTLRSLEAKVDAAESAFEAWRRKDPVCPTCGMKLDTLAVEYEAASGKAREQVKRAKAALSDCMAECTIAELEAAISAIKSRKDSSRQAIKMVAENRDTTIAAIQKENSTLRQASEVSEKNKRIADQLSRAKGQLATLQVSWPSSPDMPQLEKLEAAKSVVDGIRGEIAALRSKATMIQAAFDAEQAFVETSVWDQIATLVSSTSKGIRSQRTAAAIKETNDFLKHVVPWANVNVTKSMTLQCHGHLLADASGSEQWISEIALRLAIGAKHKAPAIVIDGLDILSASYLPTFRRTIETVAQEQGIAVLLTETVAGAKFGRRVKLERI